MRRWLELCGILLLIGVTGFFAIVSTGLTVIGPVASHLRENETIEAARPEYGHIIKTRDGALYYQQHGDVGPIVIVAHGSGAWSQFWEGSFRPLVAAGFRVVAFDMPPMGYSGPAKDHNYDRVAQAQRVEDLIHHLGAKPILVGHSFGAGPMVEAAFRNPDRVTGLIIIDGALSLNAHESPTSMPFFLQPLWFRQIVVSLTGTNPMLTRTFLKQLVYRQNAITDRHIDILQQPQSIHGTTENISHWLESLLVTPDNALSIRSNAYESFPLPTHIIWGQEDTVTPLSQAQAIHQLLPHSTLTTLTKIGHIPHIEDPDAFNTALITALKQLTANPLPN